MFHYVIVFAICYGMIKQKLGMYYSSLSFGFNAGTKHPTQLYFHIVIGRPGNAGKLCMKIAMEVNLFF